MKLFLSLFVFVCCIFVIPTNAQVPSWNWSTALASNDADIGRALFVDSAGFTYQVGSFASSTISLPSLSVTNNSGVTGTSDIVISKFDKFGVPIWQVKAGGTGNDVANCVTVDNNGNVYVGGFTQSSNCVFYGSSNLSLNAGSSTDFFVAKYNSSGSVLWVKTSSGSGSESILAINSDNNYIYAGGYFTPNLTIPSLGSVSSAGGEDMLLLKYDLSGNIIWAKSAGSTGNDRCTGIVSDQTNIYVCGYATDGITYSGTVNITKPSIGVTGTDLTLAKLDANGNVLWAASEGNANDCSANAISVLKNNVVVGGTYIGALTYSTTVLNVSANNEMFFAEYSRNGAYKGAWSAASSGQEMIYGVASDARFVYVSGRYSNTINFGGTSGVATSTSNLFVACYDTLFNLQFVKFGTGNSVNQSLACHSNQNGMISITGTYNGNSIQFAPLASLSSVTAEDVFVANLSNCPVVLSNTIMGSQTICSTTSPTTLTGSLPTGGNNMYTYLWQSSINGTLWVSAIGTNTLSTYSSPNLTQTTLLRRVVTSCSEVNTSNSLTITVVPLPTPAAAGLDQVNLCGVTTTTLNGNTPSIGTGSWTVLSGIGGTFISATNPTTSFNGIAGNSYTLNWTISNATCVASADDVVITFNLNPTTAVAGIDQVNLCGVTSTSLNGNTASVGTGSWTVFSGTGGTFVSATNPSTTFNGIAGNSYTLNWIISNAPCTASIDDVVISFNQFPSTAAAGFDQVNLCGVTTTTLNGNTPSIGTGSWTILSGTGGTFVSATNPTTAFNGIAGNSYTLNWTISNASCLASLDDVVITFNQFPTTAAAGSDQTLCVSTVSLTANAPTIGTGLWSIISGSGGSFLNANNPTTSFNGLAGTNYVLRWSIDNAPCLQSFDDVTLVFNQLSTVPIAGNDQTVCATSATLSANQILTGVGLWSIAAGTGGTFLDSSNPNSTFNGIAGNTYTLQWTVSNPPCAALVDEMILQMNQNPSSAAAGSDQLDLCGVNSTSLNGNIALIGSGSWSVLNGSGGTFVDATNPNTIFNGVAGNTYTLQWQINNAPCVSSIDEVIVAFKQNPSLARLGNDRTVCSKTIVLVANTPSVGIGRWKAIKGQGNLGSINSPNTTINNLDVGINEFEWQISNLNCPVSADTIAVLVDEFPTKANAGPDLEINSNVVNLSAQEPTIGIGSWTLLSGSGSFDDASQAKTIFTAYTYEINYLMWSVKNGVCPVSSDTLIVNKKGLLIPELITPNGDGANDYLVINIAEYTDNIKIEILNSWGGVEYASSNYKNEFNGINKEGVALPDGTYFVILSIPTNKTYTGYLIIKRR